MATSNKTKEAHKSSLFWTTQLVSLERQNLTDFFFFSKIHTPSTKLNFGKEHFQYMKCTTKLHGAFWNWHTPPSNKCKSQKLYITALWKVGILRCFICY